MKMSVEHWWNVTDRGGQEDWDRHLSDCRFVHLKPHMFWPGVECGLLPREAGN